MDLTVQEDFVFLYQGSDYSDHTPHYPMKSKVGVMIRNDLEQQVFFQNVVLWLSND